MILKKKHLVTATLALALGAAIFVNWYYSKPETKPTLDSVKTTTVQSAENLGDAQYVSATTSKGSGETLAGFKLKRDTAHDEAEEKLNSVIKDGKSSAEAVKESTAALGELAQTIKTEADLENLITAKISKDCIVIIDSDVCQVIVPKKTLTDNISLQIKELVVNQTEISSKNITIIELST